MNRTFEDGWYWINGNHGWRIIHVYGGLVYVIGMRETKYADDVELNKFTRVKITPPTLDYGANDRYS